MKVNGPQIRTRKNSWQWVCRKVLLFGIIAWRNEIWERFEGGQSKRISWHCEGVLSVSQQWHWIWKEKTLCPEMEESVEKVEKKWQCSRGLNMAEVWRCWTWLGLRMRDYEFESYFLWAYWECREGFQLNQNSLDWSSSRPWVLVLLLTSTQLGGCSSRQ